MLGEGKGGDDAPAPTTRTAKTSNYDLDDEIPF